MLAFSILIGSFAGSFEFVFSMTQRPSQLGDLLGTPNHQDKDNRPNHNYFPRVNQRLSKWDISSGHFMLSK